MSSVTPDKLDSTQPPRLARSRDDRVVAGVCGGLGRHLGIDPVIIRIAVVVLALAGGSGVLAYLIAWLIIPEAEPSDAAPAQRQAADGQPALVVGLGLVVIGGLLLVDRLWPVFSWRYVGPVILILLGAVLLVRRGGSR